ncbi:hypothetical protein QA596_02080 [Balneolales bacterium ANBcel1]|nr:hypothetical protein [Balneolales bacterium ANBcel1]
MCGLILLLALPLFAHSMNAGASGEPGGKGVIQQSSQRVLTFRSDADGMLLVSPDSNDIPTALPFGKKIILTGSHHSRIRTLEIRQFFGDHESVVPVNLQGRHWSAVTGPFPPNEDVVFLFSLATDLTASDKQTILDQFRKSLGEFVGELRVDGLDDRQFRDSMRVWLDEYMPPEFEDYADRDGRTLRSIIVEAALDRDLSAVRDSLINAQRNMTGLRPVIEHLMIETDKQKHQTLDSLRQLALEAPDDDSPQREELEESLGNWFRDLKELGQSVLDAPNLLYVSRPLPAAEYIRRFDDLSERLNRFGSKLREWGADDPPFLTAMRNHKQGLKLVSESYLNSLQTLHTAHTRIVADATQEVEQAELVSAASFSSEIGTKDIESYAGFDVGPLVIPAAEAYGYFFTVNIYPGKVDANRDPRHWYKDRLSLTAGIGLTTPYLDADGPVFYAGAGYRINRAFRVTGGATFYRPEGDDSLKWMFGTGVTLHFRFINDLLHIFSGSTTGF